jgi:subtilase family serine protease
VQALFDADIAVLDGNGSHPLASIAANSWDLPGSRALPAEYINLAHAFLLRAAGEGVGMYYSSGDSPGVSIPASDPYATAVGGTTVAIDAHNQRVFETGWSNYVQGIDPKTNGYTPGVVAGAAGGGASPLWSQPWYQKGIVPPSMSTPPAGDKTTPSRTVPDISALADATTGFSAAETEPPATGAPASYQTYTAAGTSLSAPLVAGMVAAAQQGERTPFGFINPLLYSLTGTSAVRDVLPLTSATAAQYRGIYCAAKTCDGPDGNAGVTVRSFDSQDTDFTDQVTAKGYDTMTGIGTPDGQSFLTALREADN